MPELLVSARRVGDLESRTEEYVVAYWLEGAEPREVGVRYLASRAYEINAALDDAVVAAREAISSVRPELAARPADRALAQLTWRAVQAAKYEGGARSTARLEI